MIKHTTQKRMLVLLLVSLCFVATHILVFSPTEVQGVDIVESIDLPGDNTAGVAWDGHYLWIADNEDNKFYKLNSSTGEVVDSIDFPLEWSPEKRLGALTWDGSFLWVLSGDIYKLNSSTGEVVDSFTLPAKTQPQDLAWDGHSLWFTDYDGEKIYRINPSTGAVVSTIDSPEYNQRGLAWDGHYLWISTRANCKAIDKMVECDTVFYKISRSTGAVKDSFPYPFGAPGDMAWDGHYLWVKAGTKLHKIDLVAESRPNVEITTPYSGDTVQGTITIFAYAKDADGIDKVDFYIDGSLAYTDTYPSDNMYVYHWDSTSVRNGKYTIKVTAYDGWNNTNSHRITVTVNNFALVEITAISCPDEVEIFQPFTIAVTIQNKGVIDAENVTATIKLPSGVSLTSGSTETSIGTIKAGENTIVYWDAKAAEPGDFSITVSIDSANGGSDSSTDALYVKPGVVYILTKTTYAGLPPVVWIVLMCVGSGIVVLVILKKRGKK